MFSHIITCDLSLPCRLGLSLICPFICGRVLSRDCYESLAAISRDNVSDESQVTIQRIDNNSDSSVAFTEREIVAASQRGIEVR
jgi:hypothetical protein